MGSTGIVAQVPFIAASTALIPIVAPLILFMIVGSVTTGARLDRVQRALGALSENLAPLFHRFENQGDFGRPERFSESFDVDPVQVE